MKVFVTGGSGFLGGHLINTLVDRGDQVAALARSDSAAETVAALGAAPVRGSLASIEELTQGMDGAALVVDCAAIVRQWGNPADFWETNVEGTRNIIEACRSAAAPRLVHVSTEAVLLEGGPLRRVDESDPYPDRFAGIYPETKARAEQLVLGAADESLNTVAVRPRFLWGPGDLTLIATLAE
jgi:nucleoside-diphosphate-sugar epimerase